MEGRTFYASDADLLPFIVDQSCERGGEYVNVRYIAAARICCK